MILNSASFLPMTYSLVGFEFAVSWHSTRVWFLCGWVLDSSRDMYYTLNQWLVIKNIYINIFFTFYQENNNYIINQQNKKFVSDFKIGRDWSLF